MEIKRAWWNANKNTFDIKPIREFILKHIEGEITIDPFANKNKIAKITNDLDSDYDTNYHMDAIDFIKNFPDESIDFVLFDPPLKRRWSDDSRSFHGNRCWETRRDYNFRRKQWREWVLNRYLNIMKKKNQG